MKNLSLADRLKAVKWAGETPAGVKVAAYTGKWIEYRKAVELAAEGLEVPGKFEKEGIEHTLLGEFNEVTGKFQGGGLHSPHTLKNGMDNGILEVVDANDTSKIYKKFSDIPVRSNGVRDVAIRRTSGFSYKTIFPEEWSDKDIVDAIEEASNNGFPYSVTKNGKTVQIDAYMENGLISTAYSN